jgi:hypothetical protein
LGTTRSRSRAGAIISAKKPSCTNRTKRRTFGRLCCGAKEEWLCSLSAEPGVGSRVGP